VTERSEEPVKEDPGFALLVPSEQLVAVANEVLQPLTETFGLGGLDHGGLTVLPTRSDVAGSPT
jgi:hypothetical protein